MTDAASAPWANDDDGLLEFLLQEDDPKTLDGLAFAADFDPFADDFRCRKTEPPAVATAMRPFATERPRARVPRREEIKFLRDELVRLQALHSVLVKRKVPGGAASPSSDDGRADPTSVDWEAAAWKQIADAHFENRERAVEENLRLRKRARQNAQLVARMEKQLRVLRSYVQRDLQVPANHLVPQLQYPHSVVDEPATFEQLAAGIERLYEQTATFFVNSRLHHDSVAEKRRAIEPRNQDILLDSYAARLVPFDFDATAEAVWEWVARGQPEVAWQINKRGGQVEVSFSLRPEARLVRGKLVARRFVEADRVVIVTSAIVELAPETPTGDNILMRHSQWLVISRSEAPAPLAEIASRDVSEHAATPSDLSRVHDTVATELEKYHCAMHAFIDNTLLEAALHTKN